VSKDRPSLFHVELKQSIHQGRRFNLSREQLDAEFLRPWQAGRPVEIDEHEYRREKARIRVVEAPELLISEMGLGRGWQTVEKVGEDVTDRVLSEATSSRAPAGAAAAVASEGLAEFKSSVLGACSLEPRALSDIVRLAAVRHPGARASECLALAEQAVWELLHQQKLAIYTDDDSGPVPPERWEPLVLAWESWSCPLEAQPRVQALAAGHRP
jgi:hypothetical protein